MFSKHVGKTVDVIYQDKQGNFSKRCVLVKRVQNGYAYVHCFTSNGPRVLIIGNILAAQRAG